MDSPPSMSSFNPNKHLKEQFVSNLTGSSMLEIFLLSVLLPVVVILRRVIGFDYSHDHSGMARSSKKKDDDTVNTKDSSAYMASLIVDFLFIVVPILLIFTVLSEWTHVMAALLTLILLLCIIVKRDDSSIMKRRQSLDFTRKILSSFRALTMMVTCFCILAVDFQIFPRKYAKTETYGTGWMDLGVGSFVLANALVSRQARNVHSVGLKTALQSTCPLILLGLGRIVSTRGIDYQVHVGEYGVHWNFFFTLAAVALLTSIINIHPRYCGILGLFILTGYQIFLVQGLNAYLLSDARGMDIISQNKEGIFSIFGYWGLYLVGVQMGYHIFFQNDYPASSDRYQRTKKKLFVMALLLWLLTVILDHLVERVSRRMCNMSYVMLVLAVNFQILAVAMLSEYMPGSNFTVLERAFNQNLLALFLLANVLTGLNYAAVKFFVTPAPSKIPEMSAPLEQHRYVQALGSISLNRVMNTLTLLRNTNTPGFQRHCLDLRSGSGLRARLNRAASPQAWVREFDSGEPW